MNKPSVYFVGDPTEVSHHAAPFRERLNVKIASSVDVIQQAYPGDLAIFYSEHFDRFRECCTELKRNNVATLYLIDGILEWRNAWDNLPVEIACPYTMRPVLSHKAACIGGSQAHVLNQWGNLGKTEVVGIPRLDSAPVQPIPPRADGEFRILVMTAKTPGFTPTQISTVKQSLQDLKQWANDNAKINLEGPFAPAESLDTKLVWRLTGGLENGLGVTNELNDLTGKELTEALPQVDAVITTASTAMLESMRMGIPTALLDYHNCPRYVNAGWTISAPEQISSTIMQLAQPTPEHLFYQQTQLCDALLNVSNATDRLVELVEQMLSIAGKQLTTSPKLAENSLTFPDAILKPAEAAVPRFSHQQLYPEVPEFQQDQQVENQVQLAHSRREISHLHSEQSQLRAELNEAHQIFEQIEKHPIAGPIVRVRQKMIGLMEKMGKRKNKLQGTGPIIEPSPLISNEDSLTNNTNQPIPCNNSLPKTK